MVVKVLSDSLINGSISKKIRFEKSIDKKASVKKILNLLYIFFLKKYYVGLDNHLEIFI